MNFERAMLEALIGGGWSDWEKLEEYMNEWKIDVDDLVDEVEYIWDSGYKPDFNDLMYAVLSIIEDKAKENIEQIADNLGFKKPEEIWEYDVGKYVNYLDSWFDDEWFGELYYMEDVNEKFVKEMYEQEFNQRIENDREGKKIRKADR